MEIKLNSALAMALPYAPYVAAGVATIAALAAIYFYIQNKSATPPEPLPTSKDAVHDLASEAADRVMNTILDELIEENSTGAIHEIDRSAVEAFNASATEATHAPRIQVACGQLERALDTALKTISTSEGLAALTEAFTKQAYEVYHAVTKRPIEKLHGLRPMQDFLKAGFRSIWEHAAATAEALLPAVLEQQVPNFKEAGVQVVQQRFIATETLEEKRRLAHVLKELGVEEGVDAECVAFEIELLRNDFNIFGRSPEEKEAIIHQLAALGAPVDDLYQQLTVTAMIHGNYAISTPHQEALQLHRDLNELHNLETITVRDIAEKVPAGLFSDALVKEIKNLPGDAAKNGTIHSTTDTIAEHYKKHFSFGPVRDIFIALTKKIDAQTAPTFNLANHGEMECIIQAALWVDLLSLGAKMGHRDLTTEMNHTATDAAIAAI